MIKFYQAINDIDEMRESQPLYEFDNIKAEIPFNSTNKYMLMIRAPSDDNPEDHKGEFLLLMKGAPERIWGRCAYYLKDGEETRITKKLTKKYDETNSYFANLGQRVFGFASMWLPSDEYPPNFHFNMLEPNFPMENLVFLGLISLEDPPRLGVPLAVEKCQSAGIKVIMVTGDQPDTAAAIARQVKIITEEKTVNEIAKEDGISFEKALGRSDAIVIHGDMLLEAMKADDNIDDPDQRGKTLRSWLNKKEVVFARTSPAQKLIIVEGCQNLGHIVAVTGDGVNDSPAIKKADIGIAMGIVGSDVAKDAADMILLTDDFTAIVDGVEQGRLIFDNLKKCICYVLSSNIPEIAPFLCLIIFQLPLALTTVMILFIDLGTDIVPSIAMAYEKAELDIMLRKPRNARTEHLVPRT
jgi:sodium/potassium-transporting ATPase subunit alpha